MIVILAGHIIVSPGARVAARSTRTPFVQYFHANEVGARPKLARFAAMHGCSDCEFLAGIPGTVGGALAMNAGCYGGETWNHVTSVETVDRHGARHTRTNADYEIGYRHVRSKAGLEEWFV